MPGPIAAVFRARANGRRPTTKQVAALAQCAAAMFEVLIWVRDHDDKQRAEGLPRIPGPVRSRLDRALALATGGAVIG